MNAAETPPSAADSLQRALAIAPIHTRSLWRDALRRLLRNRLSLVGLIMSAFFVLVAIFGPLVAPYPYQQQALLHQYELPSNVHLLGTDQLGRDLLSRVLWGARTAILVGIVVTGI